MRQKIRRLLLKPSGSDLGIVVVESLFVVAPIVCGVCVGSLFCNIQF